MKHMSIERKKCEGVDYSEAQMVQAEKVIHDMLNVISRNDNFESAKCIKIKAEHIGDGSEVSKVILRPSIVMDKSSPKKEVNFGKVELYMSEVGSAYHNVLLKKGFECLRMTTYIFFL